MAEDISYKTYEEQELARRIFANDFLMFCAYFFKVMTGEVMKINNIDVINSYGDVTDVMNKDATMSFLSISYPKKGNIDSVDPNYKDTNVFELLFDVRTPQIIFNMSDYLEYPEEERKYIKNELLHALQLRDKIKNLCFVDGEGDLVASYESCEAIKQWCENTQKLIARRCRELYKENVYDSSADRIDQVSDSGVISQIKELQLSDQSKFEKFNK